MVVGVTRGVMVNKLARQTITCEFKSNCSRHIQKKYKTRHDKVKSWSLGIVQESEILPYWQIFAQKNATSYIEQVFEATPYKAATVRTPTTHDENYPN